MKDFINSSWFVFKWGLLAALVAVAGLAVYFYSRVNDEIRQRVLAKWREHYPNLLISVRSAQLVEGEGIEIRGLSLADPNAIGPQAELAYFDEIVLFCQTSLPELMKGEPKIARVLVRRPTIHATRRADGSWSAARMLPLPKFSKKPVEIGVENGTLDFFDPLKNPTSTYTLRDVNLQATPLPTADPEAQPNIEVRGYLAGDHFQRVEVTGTCGPGFKSFDIGGVLMGLDVSPELRDSLPSDLAEKVAPISALRGQARITFHLRDNPAGPSPFRFDIQGQLTGGRFEHPRLPDQLTALFADFQADNNGITIKNLQARNGQATLQVSGRIQGFGPGAPLAIKAHAEHLILNHTWETCLPPPLLAQWRKFLPAGEITADATVTFDGRTWRPDVTVQCINVSVSYYRFPYRLDRAVGLITFKDNHVSVRLDGGTPSQPIHVEGDFDNPGEHFTGDIVIEGKNLSFDDQRLFDAMAARDALADHPTDTSRVLRSLNPGGTFDFNLHNGRTDPNGPLLPTLKVALNRASIRYEKFPYPITNIRGLLVMVDNHWTFRQLTGTNGAGLITCEGWLNPVDPTPTTMLGGSDRGWELSLHFTGKNIPLLNDLCEALNAQSQRVWRQLKPQGAVNFTADMHYLTAGKTPDLNFTAQPVDETVSVEPEMFPYRLERLHGQLVYREGHIDLTGLHALHDRTTVGASGFCDFDREGNWRLQFNRIAVDHLRADRDLLAALSVGSGRLKKSVVSLNPEGAINVNDGMLEFSGTAAPGSPVRSKWDLPFAILQGTVGTGIRVENITGGVRLIGECDGQHAHSRGLVSIDSLTFKDFQFTKVEGPLWIDEAQVIFGSEAEKPQPGQPPHRMTGRFYGGYLQADCRFILGDPSRYSLVAVLNDADLKKFAHETVAGKQKLDGRAMIIVRLTGDTTGIHSLNGAGEMRLTQAAIFELPFMTALLKTLNFQPPTKTAFTNCSVEYRLAGDHVYLDKLGLNGDAISLEGGGELGLDGAIDLRFHPLPGRGDWELPVFKTVMGAASRQVVQVRVVGTLSDPRMSREVLPGVGKAIQQVQTNMENRSQAIYPQARGAPPQFER